VRDRASSCTGQSSTAVAANKLVRDTFRKQKRITVGKRQRDVVRAMTPIIAARFSRLRSIMQLHRQRNFCLKTNSSAGALPAATSSPRIASSST
jgi:hypothetical protein